MVGGFKEEVARNIFVCHLFSEGVSFGVEEVETETVGT